jgi:hypothetical protein
LIDGRWNSDMGFECVIPHRPQPTLTRYAARDPQCRIGAELIFTPTICQHLVRVAAFKADSSSADTGVHCVDRPRLEIQRRADYRAFRLLAERRYGASRRP